MKCSLLCMLVTNTLKLSCAPLCCNSERVLFCFWSRTFNSAIWREAAAVPSWTCKKWHKLLMFKCYNRCNMLPDYLISDLEMSCIISFG